MSSFWYELPKEFSRMEVERDPANKEQYLCKLVNTDRSKDGKYSSIVGIGKYPVDAVISASKQYSDEKLTKLDLLRRG